MSSKPSKSKSRLELQASEEQKIIHEDSTSVTFEEIKTSNQENDRPEKSLTLPCSTTSEMNVEPSVSSSLENEDSSYEPLVEELHISTLLFKLNETLNILKPLAGKLFTLVAYINLQNQLSEL